MLNRRFPSVMIINPTDMTDDEEIILNYVLEHQALQGVYYHNKNCLLVIPRYLIEYETDIDIGPFNHVELTHPIMRRSRKNDLNQYRYEIYGNVIGGGGCGKVSMSAGTLVPLEKRRMFLKKTNVRVIKEMVSKNDAAHQKIANQEYEMTKRDKELGAKCPVFFNNHTSSQETHSFMVMKFIPGDELRKIITKDQINKENENYIDTDTRIKISISIARALEVVHRNNIIHGDIKSTNVIIDMHSPIMKAKIIDYGGSRDKNDYSNVNHIYTPLYAAPEVQDGYPPSQESDIYSASWLFNEIWRGDDHPAQQLEDKLKEKIQNPKKPLSYKKLEKKKKEIYKKIESVSHHCKFKNLFIGINDLDKLHRYRIENLLRKKTNKTPDARGYFKEIIDVFEDISFDRMIKKFPSIAKSDFSKYKTQEQYINELKTAHTLGIQLRNHLDKFVISNISSVKIDDLTQIKFLFTDSNNGILVLSNHAEVISLFIERLQVMAFLGLKSKQEILGKLSEIIDGYILNMQILLKMKDQIAELRKKVNSCIQPLQQAEIEFNSHEIYHDLTKIENEVLFILKNQSYQVTIDKIVSVNIKLTKSIDRLKTDLTINNDKLEAKQKELETKREALSKISSLDNYFQCAKRYINQLGLFGNAQQCQSNETVNIKHQVRLTIKNYC